MRTSLYPLIFLLTSFLCCQSGQNTFTHTGGTYRINDYLDTLLANGFDFPFGNGDGGGSYTGSDGKTYDGWYIATHTAEVYTLGIHTGEDWNGTGGGNTDKGQPVYSTALGKVIAAEDYGSPWGNVVLVEHRYIENGLIQTVYSLYAHLEKITTRKGQVVKKREKIGTIGTGGGAYPAHLHFEMRKPTMKDYEVTYWPSSNDKSVDWVKKHYYSPSDFIKAHRKCDIPAEKDQIVIAIKHDYKLYLISKGVISKTYDIALSQDPEGHKEKQGDNRLPEGAYRIIQKSKGPFSGDYAHYFGPVWMRISYPNVYDAEEAFTKKLITQAELNKIRTSHQNGTEPPKNTALGGGIGIHGWAGEWPSNNRHLTWGCISMRNKDLPGFYELVEVGIPIFIAP